MQLLAPILDSDTAYPDFGGASYSVTCSSCSIGRSVIQQAVHTDAPVWLMLRVYDTQIQTTIAYRRAVHACWNP